MLRQVNSHSRCSGLRCVSENIKFISGLALAVLVRPQFCDYPDLLSRDTACLDSLADASLILISVSCVNVADTNFQSIKDSVLCFSTLRHHIHAKSELRYLCAVIQSNVSLQSNFLLLDDMIIFEPLFDLRLCFGCRTAC